MSVLSSTRRFLSVRPHPLKVIAHSVAVHRAALHLVDHIQVLEHSSPEAVILLEQWARELRDRAPKAATALR